MMMLTMKAQTGCQYFEAIRWPSKAGNQSGWILFDGGDGSVGGGDGGDGGDDDYDGYHNYLHQRQLIAQLDVLFGCVT